MVWETRGFPDAHLGLEAADLWTQRIKSLLEEANMDPCESLLQYVGGKEDGSQEAKSLLSFHPYSSKDFQMGREQSSWLKSPPMITGPGHEAVAVTLVL